MKNVIFTISDSKYGDFLADQWFVSLKKNVNLKNIDVVIIDYGLTRDQISRLKGAKIIKGKRDGHVTSIRFRDFYRFLKKHKYDQVLSTDGGDIIFQTDINELFEKNKGEYRAVCEDCNVPFQDFFLKDFFAPEEARKIKKLLQDKRMINAGVICASYEKFLYLCRECNRLIINKTKFGPDQVAVNYVLYKKGFCLLDKKYNYVITTAQNRFHIKDGCFYLDNKKIAIVHNAGASPLFRPIKHFGYGKHHNRAKPFTLFVLRNIYRIINSLKKHE